MKKLFLALIFAVVLAIPAEANVRFVRTRVVVVQPVPVVNSGFSFSGNGCNQNLGGNYSMFQQQANIGYSQSGFAFSNSGFVNQGFGFGGVGFGLNFGGRGFRFGGRHR